MKTIISIFVFTIFSVTAYTQSWQKYLPKEKIQNGTLNFFDYQEAFYKYWEPFGVDHWGYYYENGEKVKAAGWKQFKRWEHEMSIVVDLQTGEFPKTNRVAEMRKYNKTHPTPTDNIYGNWTNLGVSTSPGGYNGLGRLNCIAFHPTDNNTFWVGAATGGLWVTYDGGSSWATLTDDIVVIGVSDIIIPSDYATSHTIYIATGDRDTWELGSIGVLKSTNSGATWDDCYTFNFDPLKRVFRLLIHPTNNNILWAATSFGLYYTTDAGNNWNKIANEGFMDMEFHPSDPDIMYASTEAYYDDSTRIYKSTDAGDNWDCKKTIQGGRTELAVSPDEPNWVYAVMSNSSSGLYGIYRSTNSGNFYSLRFDGMIPGNNLLASNCAGTGTGGIAWWSLCIAADPNDANTLFTGCVYTHKSTDAGLSWAPANDAYYDCPGPVEIVHADKHWLAFQNGSSTLFECNDGGLYKTTDLGTNWTDLSNGLITNQFYRIACSYIYDEVIGGLQDNGSKLWSGGSWTNVDGADGTNCLIDPSNYYIQYCSQQNGGIFRTDNHWSTKVWLPYNIPGDSGNWVTPYTLQPNNSMTLFVGYTDLWKSNNRGDVFFKLWDVPDPQYLKAVTVAPSSYQTICISNPNNIYRTTNGGTSWTIISSGLPLSNHNIECITIENNNPETIWVTLTKYDNHGVYKSIDGGSNWTNISDGLPNMPVMWLTQNTLVSTYEELYAATYGGVFLKLGDQPWVPFNGGLPNVATKDVDIYYDGSNSKLRVGTWGRGLWESDLYSVETGMPGIWTGIESDNWWDPDNWNYMAVPDVNSDVTIPAGCPNNPYITGAWTEIKSLTIESGATLIIGDDILIVEEDATIAGLLYMNDNSGSLKVKEDINWESTSSVSIMADSATIIVEDDWIFKPGSNINMNTGFVYFYGGSHSSSIYKYSPNGSFHHLIVEKSSPRTLAYSVSSIGDLIVNGDFTILTNNEYIHQAPGNLEINGAFLNFGEFKFNDGGLVYGGPLSVLSGNSNCYFNDLTIDGNLFTYLSLDFDATINGDLNIINGSLDPLSNTVHLKGDWNNSAGASGFIQNTSNVIFEGTSTQILTNNETFHMLTLDNASPGVLIQNGAIECGSYNWTSGTLEVKNNGTFIAQDLDDQCIKGSYNVSGTGAIELHSSTFIHLAGDVTIIGGIFDVYGGIMYSSWPGNLDATLTLTAGEFNFHDQGIYIHDNNSQTFTENITGGSIRTAGNLSIETTEFSPAGGAVELFGNDAASVAVDPGISFYDFKVNKSTATDQLKLNTPSQKKVKGRHTKAIREQAKKALPPTGTRSGPVSVASDLDIMGSLIIENGEFDIGANTVDVGQGIYIYGTLIMNDPASQLNGNQSFLWHSGSDANVTDGDITFKGNWTFYDGTDAQFTGNNFVTAIGTTNQTLTCYDDNASLRYLINNNTTAVVDINTLVNAFRVSATLVLYDNSELLVDDSLWVGTVFNVHDLATATVNGGNLHCNNLMILNGTLDVLNGDVRVLQTFTYNSTGTLNVNGGFLYLDMPYSGTLIDFPGTTNINAGMLQVTNDGVLIDNGSNFNLTGGSLRVGYVLRAEYPGTFQPSGGKVLMISGNTGQIRLSNGNYLHDLYINKIPAGSDCSAADSIVIQGDLKIYSGDLLMLNQFLDISGDLLIEPDGLLAPGNTGIVEIEGDWTNNRGDAGFIESTSTVEFIGTYPSTIQTSETFYDVFFDKTLGAGEFITLAIDDTLSSLNNMEIQNGVLRLQEDCYLNVNNLNIFSGAGLIADTLEEGIKIDVNGDWNNANSGFTSNTGFNHQLCEVTFSGNTDQSMISTGGEEFYRLYLDKNNGKFEPENNIIILDSCCVMDGVWGFGTSGLNHYFHGDLEILFSGQWWDSTCQLSFVGEGEQWLKNLMYPDLKIWDLYVDQTLGDPNTKLMVEGDVKCKHWVYIPEGTMEINGGTLSVDERIQVNTGGKLSGLENTTIRMADAAHILLNGGIADTNTGFQHCTFQNGIAGGTLIQHSTDQEVEFFNVNFPDTPVGGNYNVKKTNDAGSVSFNPAFRAFAGEDYEDDIHGRVHWDLGAEWIGLVSTDWHTAGNWVNDNMPASNTDVLIPDNKPNDPTISNGHVQINSLFIESNTTLTLASSYDLFLYEDAEIWGTLAFSSNEDFTVQGDLTWKPGSDMNASSTCDIDIYGDMIIENGSDLNITGGYTEFRGSSPSYLICHQDSAAVYQLRINKSAGAPFYFDASSTGDFFINSFFYNLSGNIIYGDAPIKIYIGRSYINSGGNFYSDNTHFVFNGNAGFLPLKMSPGDYFNDLTIASTTLLDVDITYSDTVHIKGDLKIIPGTSGSSGIDANEAYMLMEGEWMNYVGTSAFVHGNNRVEFTHDVSTLTIYGDNIFYRLIDNTEGTSHLRLMGDIQVENRLTVNNKVAVYYDLIVDNVLNLGIATAELVLQSGSYTDIWSLWQGGTITCNSGDLYADDIRDDYLRGAYVINGGTVEIHQDAIDWVHLGADITISNGSMLVYGGSSISQWPAPVSGNHPTITMSGGVLDFVDQGIHIEDNSASYSITDNITGGIIRTSSHFYCRGSGTDFSPAGGLVEMYGTYNTDCEMSGSNNAFWPLRVAKSGGNVVKNPTSINIQNSLIIQSGMFHNLGNPVFVGP